MLLTVKLKWFVIQMLYDGAKYSEVMYARDFGNKWVMWYHHLAGKEIRVLYAAILSYIVTSIVKCINL